MASSHIIRSGVSTNISKLLKGKVAGTTFCGKWKEGTTLFGPHMHLGPETEDRKEFLQVLQIKRMKREPDYCVQHCSKVDCNRSSKDCPLGQNIELLNGYLLVCNLHLDGQVFVTSL